MIESLKDYPIDARVLTLTDGQPLQREIEDLGVPVEWVGARPSQAARLRAIVASLRSRPVDVVQSIHFYANLYAALPATLMRITSIGAIRGDGSEALRANRVFGLADLLLPDYLVVNSRPAHRYALDKGRSPARVRLVRNAVDTGRFTPDGKRGDGSSSDSLRLLFVGRLSGEKRADRFLRLVERTCCHLPHRQVEARIAGNGPDRPALQALRSSLGLDPARIQFLAEVDDTAPLYSWADILVLTSDHEGTPNVVLEAMAAGVPVVATAVGGVPDLLSQGGGLLVRPEREDALATAVSRLATDTKLATRLAEEGIRYVARNHSLDSLGAQLEELYRTAVEARTATPATR
jgi:glycosyltransferase involved in cell wall biosynthesis